MICITECPRDAIQGFGREISTSEKKVYYQMLQEVNFHLLDIGSFVSPKAIPQMADTAALLQELPKLPGNKWLVIVANARGALQACAVPKIDFLGFPFSLSPTFQQRNTNSSPEESFERVLEIQSMCAAHGKQLMVYLSMAFGNPYGDEYSAALIDKWALEFVRHGITHLSLADTVGLATPEQIYEATSLLLQQYPSVTTSVHLHCTPHNWAVKLQAALDAGCTHIDTAFGGAGGCPMAQDDLVGNLATEHLVQYCTEQNIPVAPLNMEAFHRARAMATLLFGTH